MNRSRAWSIRLLGLALVLASPVLATAPRSVEADRYRAIRQGFFKEDQPTDLPALGGWAVALLVTGLLFYRIWRAVNGGKRAPTVNHLAVAIDLLGLSEEQRRELLAIAARSGLPHPASMLLSPANLRHAVRAAGATDPALQARLEQLSQALFGEPLAPRKPPPKQGRPL